MQALSSASFLLYRAPCFSRAYCSGYAGHSLQKLQRIRSRPGELIVMGIEQIDFVQSAPALCPFSSNGS